jgi:hypothetical protein
LASEAKGRAFESRRARQLGLSVDQLSPRSNILQGNTIGHRRDNRQLRVLISFKSKPALVTLGGGDQQDSCLGGEKNVGLRGAASIALQ